MRGATLFRKINVPVLGLIENMSYHSCPNCGHKSHIFGQDGGKRLAEAQNMRLLGQVGLSCLCKQCSCQLLQTPLPLAEGKQAMNVGLSSSRRKPGQSGWHACTVSPVKLHALQPTILLAAALLRMQYGRLRHQAGHAPCKPSNLPSCGSALEKPQIQCSDMGACAVQIPLNLDIRTASDEGAPIVVRDPGAPSAQGYIRAAESVWNLLQQAQPLGPTIRTQS